MCIYVYIHKYTIHIIQVTYVHVRVLHVWTRCQESHSVACESCKSRNNQRYWQVLYGYTCKRVLKIWWPGHYIKLGCQHCLNQMCNPYEALRPLHFVNLQCSMKVVFKCLYFLSQLLLISRMTSQHHGRDETPEEELIDLLSCHRSESWHNLWDTHTHWNNFNDSTESTPDPFEKTSPNSCWTYSWTIYTWNLSGSCVSAAWCP